MLILTTEHYRSGCVRRTLELYDDFELAQMDAAAKMQNVRSIEAIDVARITNLSADPETVTLIRAESERSMFDASTHH